MIWRFEILVCPVCGAERGYCGPCEHLDAADSPEPKRVKVVAYEDSGSLERDRAIHAYYQNIIGRGVSQTGPPVPQTPPAS